MTYHLVFEAEMEGYTPSISVERFHQEDSLSIWVFEDHHTKVSFTLVPGWYLIYQCFKTHERFQSDNYKLKSFVDPNGVTIASKNSPLLLSKNKLFLQGAYREFDLKPSVLYVGTPEEGQKVIEGFMGALRCLTMALAEDGT
jgi:hypothetical protein